MKNNAWAPLCLVSPALLGAGLQLLAVPIVFKNSGEAGFLSFQTMLALWPWTGLAAWGMEKWARGFYAFSSAQMREAATAWRGLAVITLGLSAAGALLTTLFIQEMSNAWIAFGLLGALSGVATVGREALLACSQALYVAKVHSIALLISIGLMMLGFFMKIELTYIVVIFILPSLLAWGACCKRAGLLERRDVSWPFAGSPKRGSFSFMLQGIGVLMLSTLDVIVVTLLAPPSFLLDYVFITRVIALGLALSTGLVNSLIPKLASDGWRAVFFQASALHVGMSMAAALSMVLLGCHILRLIGVPWGGVPMEWVPAIFALCLGRGLTEAGVQLSGGAGGAKILLASLCALGGMLIFCALLFTRIAPLHALSAAWAIPAIFYLTCSLRDRK